MSAQEQAQTAIDERQIENDVLEQALEERQDVKERRATVNSQFREADERAKALASQVELEDDAPVRVGRFVLTRKTRKGKAVSFETADRTQLVIATADE